MINTRAKESRFTLHGLWPFNATQLDPNNINSDFQYRPIIEGAQVPSAQVPTSFQASQLPIVLLYKLAKSWKSYMRSYPNGDFWKDEYDKHGTCTVKKFRTPVEYFQKANDLWEANPIEDWFRRDGRFTDTDVQLAELRGAIMNKFGSVPWFQCEDKFVRQIGLCFDEVGGLGANCPKEYQKKQCPPTIQYRL
ncbi:putative ribonuclease T(2) [Rosa chinensis]|uniref:Putative ribonuclease T(2) n=1 Tax=Rosa chinensis TaxID=74649 RepID=A0A2P6SBC8_ROSCH|nr:putative ribonuclease T(2) [Rosa chinensis]